jgi:hypothetical protein
MEAPEHLCLTCRWVDSRMQVFPVGPPAVNFFCLLQAAPWVRQTSCPHHEREPGSD